jgi:serine/threonine protein phosphatase 1
MRHLAIGDIHGCLTAFDALLAAVDPQPGDVLITLGDYVDRGPDSAGVIERLLELRLRHQVIALCGNHEQMMLDTRAGEGDGWLFYGGDATLESYGKDGEPGTLDDIPESHWDFLESLRDWYEIDTHFFVHANAYPNVPLDEQPTLTLRWESISQDWGGPHYSGKIMVCGHTVQKSGLPLNLGHAVCIDTGIYRDTGWLTCLEVGSGRIWQANQLGKARIGWLPKAGETEDLG